MNFECSVCGNKPQNLYSVKLAIHDTVTDSMNDKYSKDFILEQLNSLPLKQKFLITEHKKNQFSYKRYFICGFCFNHFVKWSKDNNNVGGIPTYIEGKYWRLSTADSINYILHGKFPPIYNKQKWQKYQDKIFNKLIG